MWNCWVKGTVQCEHHEYLLKQLCIFQTFLSWFTAHCKFLKNVLAYSHNCLAKNFDTVLHAFKRLHISSEECFRKPRNISVIFCKFSWTFEISLNPRQAVSWKKTRLLSRKNWKNLYIETDFVHPLRIGVTFHIFSRKMEIFLDGLCHEQDCRQCFEKISCQSIRLRRWGRSIGACWGPAEEDEGG